VKKKKVFEKIGHNQRQKGDFAMKKRIVALTAMALLILTASIATASRDGTANATPQNITAATSPMATLDMNSTQPVIANDPTGPWGETYIAFTPAITDRLAPTAAVAIPNSVRVSVWPSNAFSANNRGILNAPKVMIGTYAQTDGPRVWPIVVANANCQASSAMTTAPIAGSS
jgi:hypothetical protein